MKTFGWSREFCMDELDGAEGWAWYYWAVINEAQVWGYGKGIKGNSYLAQERQRILAEKQNGK